MRRIERDAPGRLLLDLRSLEFLDTTGLSRLVAVRRRCRRAGRRLVLVRGSHAVQRLFALASVGEEFELIRDPEELLATA
jgi:anti-anti-sigma factor